MHVQHNYKQTSWSFLMWLQALVADSFSEPLLALSMFGIFCLIQIWLPFLILGLCRFHIYRFSFWFTLFCLCTAVIVCLFLFSFLFIQQQRSLSQRMASFHSFNPGLCFPPCFSESFTTSGFSLAALSCSVSGSSFHSHFQPFFSPSFTSTDARLARLCEIHPLFLCF